MATLDEAAERRRKIKLLTVNTNARNQDLCVCKLLDRVESKKDAQLIVLTMHHTKEV